LIPAPRRVDFSPRLASRRGHVHPILTTLLGALCLASCGRTDRAGQVDRLVAPTVRVVEPAPDAWLPVWDEGRRLGKVWVLLEPEGVRVAPTGGGWRLLFAVDDEPATRVTEPGRAFLRKATVGWHRLAAWFVDPEGRVVHAPGSSAFRRFRVGPPDGTPPPAGPGIVLAHPQGPVRAGPEGIRLDVLVEGLPAAFVQVLGPGDRPIALGTSDGPLVARDLPPGSHRLRIAVWESSSRGRPPAATLERELFVER